MRLLGRVTKTTMPCSKENLKPKIMQNVPTELRKVQQKQNEYANQKTRVIKFKRKFDGHRDWRSGTVIQDTQFPRSVIVQTTNGSLYRRKLHHLRKSTANITNDIASNFNTQKQVQPQSSNSAIEQFLNQELNPSKDLNQTNIVKPHNQTLFNQ